MTKPTTPADLRALAATCAGRADRQAAFAAFVGWDKSHVTRLKQLGQLVLTDAGLVDFPASLLRIAEHADPARDAQRQVAAAKRPEAPSSAPPAPGDDAEPPEDDNSPKYSASRATKEYWAAKQAQLEYEKASGLLVSRADVDKAVADAAMQFRQALENQPHRLADRLVGLGLEEIRTRLRDDGQQMLAELSRGFSKRLEAAGQGSAA